MHPPNSAPPSAAVVTLEDALNKAHVEFSELSPDDASFTYIDQITGTKTWMNIMDASSRIQLNSRKKLHHPQRLKLLSSLPNSIPRCHRPTVKIFLSSTFMDTQVERDAFLMSVDRILQKLALALDCDYETIEIRPVMSSDASDQAYTKEDIYLRIIDRASEDSDALSFLYISTDKFGFCILPERISSHDMHKLLDLADNNARKILLRAYQEDTNVLQDGGSFILQATDSSEFDADHVLQVLKNTAMKAGMDTMVENLNKSVTFREVEAGIIGKPDAEQKAFCFIRNLTNVDLDDSGYFDHETEQVERLRDLVRENLTGSRIDYYRIDYRDFLEDADTAAEAVTDFLQKAFVVGAASLLDAATSVRYVQDPLLRECAMHAEVAINLRENVLRTEAIDEIIGQVHDNIVESTQGHIIGLKSPRGSGKSTFLALLLDSIKLSQESQEEKVFIVYRHIATYKGDSCAFMLSVARQLNALKAELGQHHSAALENLDEDQVCSWNDARARYFAAIKGLKPNSLILAFDGLDELDQPSARFIPPMEGQTLVFTASEIEEIPVRIDWHDLTETLTSDTFSAALFQHLLAASGRQLTGEQAANVSLNLENNPMEWCITRTRALAELATRWPSWYDSTMAAELDPIIGIFEYVERCHSEEMVGVLSSLLYVSRYGLSKAELIDILSLDDIALGSIAQPWTRPVRRCPLIVVEHILEIFHPFLLENAPFSFSGARLLSWKSSRFAEAVESRYMRRADFRFSEKRMRQLLVDYFSGKYIEGKEYNGKTQDRLLRNQALVYRDYGAESYNLRHASELPYQLLMIEDWETFVKHHGNVEMAHAQELISGPSQDEIISLTNEYLQRCNTGTYEDAKKALVESYFSSIEDETSFDAIERLTVFFTRMSWFDAARRAQEPVLAQRELVEADSYEHVESMFNSFKISYRQNLRTPTVLQSGTENIMRLEMLLKQEEGPLPKQMKLLADMKSTQAAVLLQSGRAFRREQKDAQANEAFSKSLELRLSSLEMYKQLFGMDHIDTAKALAALSSTYREIGEYEKALESAETCLRIRELVLASNDPLIALTLEIVHKAIVRAHGIDNAKDDLLTQAFSIIKSYYGDVHPRVAQIAKTIGMFYASMGRNSEAWEVLLYAATLYSELKTPEFEGQTHPSVTPEKELMNIVKYLATLRNERYESSNTESTDLFVDWLAKAELSESVELAVAEASGSSYIFLAALLSLDDSPKGEPLDMVGLVESFSSSQIRPTEASTPSHTRLNLLLSEAGAEVLPDSTINTLFEAMPLPRAEMNSNGEERILVVSTCGTVLESNGQQLMAQPHIDFTVKSLAQLFGGSSLTWDMVEIARSEYTMVPHPKGLDPNCFPANILESSPFYPTLVEWNEEFHRAAVLVCHGHPNWSESNTGTRGAIGINMDSFSKYHPEKSEKLQSQLLEAFQDSFGVGWAFECFSDSPRPSGTSSLTTQYLSLGSEEAIAVDLHFSQLFCEYLIVDASMRDALADAVLSVLGLHCAP